MHTEVTSVPSRMLLLLLATLMIPALLGGCGGSGFLGTEPSNGNQFVTALALSPNNYDLLTSLTPTMKTGWYTAPLVSPVTINATSYSDGIRAAVYADVVSTGTARYHLGGKYSALGLAFGVSADEPDSPSWTAFRFYGDGREVATPHYVKKGERRTIIVDVRGVQDFDLIAEGIPQQDGFSYVSTKVGWGDATLIKEGAVTYLADLTPTSTPGWTVAPTAGTIWIDWRPYPHSMIGTIHKGDPPARIIYHLGGAYRTFAAIAGMDQDGTDAAATVTLEVVADGVSRNLTTVEKQAEVLVNMDVKGVDTLELRSKVASSTENDIKIGWGMALVMDN